MIQHEVNLFRAVLDQAMADYCLKEFKNDEEREAHEEAVEWAASDNQDFLDVCDLADLDPQVVLAVFKEMQNGKR